MTTQAQPDWNAEMDRQIKATESAQALVKDHEATIQEQHKMINLLRSALIGLMASPIVTGQLAGIRDVAKRDGVANPLYAVYVALERTKHT